VGKIFDIQRFSLYDGPGVRTVVFLKGCPLRCVWCHNPEGISAKSQILWSPSRCIGCMDCVSVCPMGCHSQKETLHRFLRTDCIGCGACADGCCTGALSLAGKEMTAQAVMEQVLRDQGVYLESGGGLTLSGGEPFAQPFFALELLRLAKKEGLHTAVETCGYVEPQVIEEAAQCTDLFLYDYKVTDPVRHEALCGVSNETILANLDLLDRLNAEVVLRCPIVPGQNDDLEHIRGIGAVAAAHACIRQVQLEPYHRLGTGKAERLGVAAFDTAPPSAEQMAHYCDMVEKLCGKATAKED